MSILFKSMLIQTSTSLVTAALMLGCLGQVDDVASDSENAGAADAEWGYLLNTDFALRGDGSGLGYFLAPRLHGLHNGLDILGVVGEGLNSPCNGVVLTGFERSFGNWAQLVCQLPTSVTNGQSLYASMFFAHMNSFGAKTVRGSWVSLSRGDRVGTIGRTGNAGSSNPHVHFEVIIHSSQSAAQAETHSGGNQSNTSAADAFLSAIGSNCLTPNGLRANQGLRRARRVDPFVFLTCLGAAKPPVQRPPSSLQVAFHPWSQYYSADTFNVDSGSLATPVESFDALEVYWAREADGSYKLHALANANVQSVEYYVDGFLIGASTRADGSNFPATYTFSSETNERQFEVKGYDGDAEQVALGVGLIDITDGTAVFIRQLGEGYYDIGLDRAPEGVAYIQVEVDGFLLTDETTGAQQSERNVVRYRFGTLGERRVAISTFNSDGSLRGTLHREFSFR